MSLFAFAATFFACRHDPRFPPGGYPYPDKVEDKDTNFYFYPVRNTFTRKDSIRAAFEYSTYRELQEPNLSLRPASEPIFRFIYGGWDEYTRVIRLEKYRLVIKKAGSYGPDPDTSKLTPIERFHKDLLDRYYPIDDIKDHYHPPFADSVEAGWHRRRYLFKRHYLDSLGHLYPQLYNPVYYRSLVEKEFPYASGPFPFDTRVIKISQQQYDHLIDLINTSEFWRLPATLDCDAALMDGFAYALEANTATQYQYVARFPCVQGDSTGFVQACQALVDAAGMGQEMHLVPHFRSGPSEGLSDTAKSPFVVQDVHLEPVEQKPRKHKKHS